MVKNYQRKKSPRHLLKPTLTRTATPLPPLRHTINSLSPYVKGFQLNSSQWSSFSSKLKQLQGKTCCLSSKNVLRQSQDATNPVAQSGRTGCMMSSRISIRSAPTRSCQSWSKQTSSIRRKTRHSVQKNCPILCFWSVKQVMKRNGRVSSNQRTKKKQVKMTPISLFWACSKSA